MPPNRRPLHSKNTRPSASALAAFLLTSFLAAAYADSQPPAQPKLTFTGELDLGVSYYVVMCSD